jgi:hypothetical protein
MLEIEHTSLTDPKNKASTLEDCPCPNPNKDSLQAEKRRDVSDLEAHVGTIFPMKDMTFIRLS